MSRKITQKTELARRASANIEPLGPPIVGDTYYCDKCGMELEVITDCKSDDPKLVHFECCGKELVRD